MKSRTLVALAPAAMLVLVLVWWAADGGGYAATTWYPGALLVLGLAVAVVVGGGLRGVRPSRPATVALAAFAAYVAWSYLSILWAEVPGDAFDGSNRALLYLLIFALAVVLPWREGSSLAALAGLALALGVVSVVTLARLAGGSAHGLFLDARLASPTGYQNANAAVFTVGALLAAGLSARRDLPWAVRAVLVAAAGAGFEVAVLAQSRGWLYTLPLVLLLSLLVVRDRVRAVLFALPPLAATAIVTPTLLDVFDRGGYHGVFHPASYFDRVTDGAAQTAGGAALAVAGVLLLAGAVMALADRRVEVGPRQAKMARRGGWAVFAVLAVAAVAAVFAASHGNPVHKVDTLWKQFKSSTQPKGASRFGAVGGSRYDFYRVGVKATGEHPLAGIGQDGYATAYYRLRRSGEEPRWAHSLELRLLVGTGIVGFLLFAVAVVAALWAAFPGRSAAGGIALLPLVPWLVHGSVDWLWEFPVLSGAALLGLGMAVSLRRPEAAGAPEGAAPTPRPALRLAGGAAAAGLALVAGLAFAFPWLAARDVANADGEGSLAAELRTLDDAAGLNPLSALADYRAGALAVQAGDLAVARQRFARAADRDPHAWLATFELGLIDGVSHRRARARAELLTARERNPRERLITVALRRLHTRRPLTPASANRDLALRVRQRAGQAR